MAKEAEALQATRGLVRLQRTSGFSMGEIRTLAQYCAGHNAGASEMSGASMLAIAVDYATFELLVCAVVPGWNNDCPLLDRLFRLFAAQPSVGEGSSEGGGSMHMQGEGGGGRELRTPGDRTPLRGRNPSLLHSPVGAAARAAAALAGDSSAGGGALTLWFDQLVCGLGWLLRGDSERRSQLCFACFDVEGDGAVQREALSTLLRGLILTLTLTRCRAARGLQHTAPGRLPAIRAAHAPAGGGNHARTHAPKHIHAHAHAHAHACTCTCACACTCACTCACACACTCACCACACACVHICACACMHACSQAAVHDARIAAVGAEAREFVNMMYALWATRPDGSLDGDASLDVLDAAQFRRAAHQHPLLVQVSSEQ